VNLNIKKIHVEVITTASKYTKEIGPEYVKSFEYLDAMNVGVCILKNEEAADETILARLKAADVVFWEEINYV
jgi:cyanophycinase